MSGRSKLMAMALFDNGALPDIALVLAAAQRLRPDVTLEHVSGEADGSSIIACGPALFVLMPIDQPYPRDELRSFARMAYWWPEAEAALERQCQHVVVAPVGDPGPEGGAVRTAQIVTLLAAAMRDASPHAIAVLWTASNIVQPAPAMEMLARQELALELWLDIRSWQEPDGAVGIRLTGLAAFVGRDLVMAPTKMLPADMLVQRSIDVAAYLMNAGPVLREGETVGISAAEQIRVGFQQNPSGPAPVYWLEVERATAL